MTSVPAPVDHGPSPSAVLRPEARYERQGGRIWAESRPGGGARFCFDLPAGPL